MKKKNDGVSSRRLTAMTTKEEAEEEAEEEEEEDDDEDVGESSRPSSLQQQQQQHHSGAAMTSDQDAGLDDGDSGTTACAVRYIATVIAIMSANAGDSRAILAPRNPAAAVASTSSTDTILLLRLPPQTHIRARIRLPPNRWITNLMMPKRNRYVGPGDGGSTCPMVASG